MVSRGGFDWENVSIFQKCSFTGAAWVRLRKVIMKDGSPVDASVASSIYRDEEKAF